MKYLSNGTKAINLANITDFMVSENYLVITATDGREIRFVYGATDALNDLFNAILAFIANDGKVFDCKDFMMKR